MTTSKCKHCQRPIGYIQSRKTGRLISVDQLAQRPDGRKQLVFADGTVGKRHQTLAIGFQAHQASCTGVPRKRTRRQVAERLQPELIEGYAGCANRCSNGWVTIERDGKTGVIPCSIHRKTA